MKQLKYSDILNMTKESILHELLLENVKIVENGSLSSFDLYRINKNPTFMLSCVMLSYSLCNVQIAKRYSSILNTQLTVNINDIEAFKILLSKILLLYYDE